MEGKPAHGHTKIDLHTGMYTAVGGDEHIDADGSFVEGGRQGGEGGLEEGD